MKEVLLNGASSLTGATSARSTKVERCAGRVMLIAVAVLFIPVLLLVVALLYMSPGTPKPFLNDRGTPLAGSLSEKIRININGMEQGMFMARWLRRAA